MLTAAVIAIASCSWTHPGADRFTGSDAAVEDFQAIPAPIRTVLRERMRKHDFDDIATITRDKIKGAAEYDDLRDMHFGKNKMCTTVERNWAPSHKEVGMVYCEGEHCLIVPTVCGNIALVTRRRQSGTAGRPQEGLIASSAGGSDTAPVIGEPLASLDDLPPTGAGVRAEAASFAGAIASTDLGSAVGSGYGYGFGSSAGSGYGAVGSAIPVVASGSGIASGGGLLIPTSTVAAVPEPTTWALMAAGLMVIGAAARRRDRIVDGGHPHDGRRNRG